jgi:hypothetical protein
VPRRLVSIKMDKGSTLPPYSSTMSEPPRYAHTNAVIEAEKRRAKDEVRTIDLCYCNELISLADIASNAEPPAEDSTGM